MVLDGRPPPILAGSHDSSSIREHQEEWTEQKEQECALNDLERDTEVVYRACIIRRQEDKLIADSKEAAAKNLLPERQAARAERTA